MPNAITARTSADLHPPPGLPLRRSRLWDVVLIVYVVLYATLLFRTDGYPYVLDNNESYSSLWHARSLYENGVAKTKGLTDEVFSTSPAASPYIHSHQGNLPRLYTFLLYSAGFHGIATQIWITTFSVGLAGIWLAFRFLSRLGNPLFATLACLVMMTNYLLFAQWQVSLYNVWHVFFFFSSLLCVQALVQPGASRRVAWLTVLNFAAFCYWEYVFTGFVVALCGLYAALQLWREPRRLIRVALLMGAGAALAAGLLLAQLTAYMGWDAVREDVRLTLSARNTASDPAMLERVTSFYREHRIIFWHNFTDASPLRTLDAFWDSLTGRHFRYYTPALSAGMLVAVLGWLAGAIRPGIVPLGRRAGWGTGLKWLVLAVPTGWLFLGLAPDSLASPTYRVGVWLGAAALTVPLGRSWLGGWWAWQRLGWDRITAAGLYCAATGWLLRTRAGLLDKTFQEELADVAGWRAWQSLTPVLLAAFALLGLTFALLGNTRLLGSSRARRLVQLPAFLLCCLVAYGVTYRVFTGYIYSGYLDRQVPLLVFATDILLAAALYLAIAPLRRAGRTAFSRLRHFSFRLPSAGLWALGAGVAVLALGHWIRLQTAYIQVAPPDSYAFLSVLDQPRFRGRSVVANTYPAPMAARTGAWGYADTSLFSGVVNLTPRGFETEREHKYLWFADRDSNPNYLKPNIAVSVVQTPNVSEALDRHREWAAAEADPTTPRATSGLIERANSPFQPFLSHRLLYSDQRRINIVGLDWEFPPFLEPVNPTELVELAGRLNLAQKFTFSLGTRELNRWRTEIELLPAQPGGNIDPSLIQLFGDGAPVRASADGRFIRTVVRANEFNLGLARSPSGGQVRITVNDTTETVDLATVAPEGLTFTWSANAPYGKYTRVPSLPFGVYVGTATGVANGRTFADVSYRYRHQESAPEAGTTVRLYQKRAGEPWRIADSQTYLGPEGVPVRLNEFRRVNPDTVAEHNRASRAGDPRTYEQWLADFLTENPGERRREGIVTEALGPRDNAPGSPGTVTRRILLPQNPGDWLQVSVTPATRGKSGPEYFGYIFTSEAPAADRAPTQVGYTLNEASSDSVPFGLLKLRVRFPLNHWPQAEPLVTTGLNEAGDILFVQYVDAEHIRFGLDHWFKGGPVTAPVAYDPSREHEIEISLGSLFPPESDILFVGRPATQINAAKRRLLVKLDGVTVLDAPGECYESLPSQVTVGANNIKGTSAGPTFSGQILSTERIWPWGD
jgi:hypothetical protein